jgi:hypothetical protein
MNVPSPCRTYIVYRHELFAQGVRGVLAQQGGVKIVGMESDMARATRAVHALRPEVILVEEPTESGVAWPFLKWAAASRIVTLSLQHAHATVYHPHRTAAYRGQTSYFCSDEYKVGFFEYNGNGQAPDFQDQEGGHVRGGF